jgi:hypothetical protein
LRLVFFAQQHGKAVRQILVERGGALDGSLGIGFEPSSSTSFALATSAPLQPSAKAVGKVE